MSKRAVTHGCCRIEREREREREGERERERVDCIDNHPVTDVGQKRRHKRDLLRVKRDLLRVKRDVTKEAYYKCIDKQQVTDRRYRNAYTWY